MAQIDSGLGWSVDEIYYVDSTEFVLCDESGEAHKAVDGPAICAGFFDEPSGEFGDFAVMSTVKEYAEFHQTGSTTGWLEGRYLGTSDRGGYTWHVYCMDYHLMVRRPVIEAARQITSPRLYVYKEDLTADDIAGLFFDAIPIEKVITGKDVPSVNHMHHYVEGVLKNIPTITNAQIDNLFN